MRAVMSTVEVWVRVVWRLRVSATARHVSKRRDQDSVVLPWSRSGPVLLRMDSCGLFLADLDILRRLHYTLAWALHG